MIVKYLDGITKNPSFHRKIWIKKYLERINHQYGSRTFFLKPIACGFSKGSVNEKGEFRRQGEAFLQFCVAGSASHCKADAYDMINVIEIAHLDGRYY